MKWTWFWFAAVSALFLLLTAGWFAIPLEYDFADAMFSGWLGFPLGYELYMILGWLIGAVRDLLAAAYALALFAVLKAHPKRVKITLFAGAGLVLLSLLMLIGMTQLGWFHAHWMLSFASSMMTSGMLVIVLAFAARIFPRKPCDAACGEGNTP